VNGTYTSRSWTEWTRGFQIGSALLQFDATGEPFFLENGRNATLEWMPTHISHTGVHDHGFNIISTYGNMLRLMLGNRIPEQIWERRYYELALKLSGAVQASRWTSRGEGGYIHSFNGPHSLFVDTIRSCRVLLVSHLLGHELKSENDASVDLMARTVQHLLTTAEFSIYYGENRDGYDVKGRTAHESIFNIRNGLYRCPNSQQGYSPFSTWMRGLAWAMLGFAEQIELFDMIPPGRLEAIGGKDLVRKLVMAARATCDFYIENTPTDGIPYWDSAAPGLVRIGDCLNRPAEPFNTHEPVDSSAAAIACQGLMRLGHFLGGKSEPEGFKYWQAGLTVAETLFGETYLSTLPDHQGLILHSVYHRPNGWDHIPEGHKIPCGESSMWGDYHAREAALYLQRIINGDYYTFFNGLL
jgi:hypothetical protein